MAGTSGHELFSSAPEKTDLAKLDRELSRKLDISFSGDCLKPRTISIQTAQTLMQTRLAWSGDH